MAPGAGEPAWRVGQNEQMSILSAPAPRAAQQGRDVELVVLASGEQGIVGLELASGAFARVLLPEPPAGSPGPGPSGAPLQPGPSGEPLQPGPSGAPDAGTGCSQPQPDSSPPGAGAPPPSPDDGAGGALAGVGAADEGRPGPDGPGTALPGEGSGGEGIEAEGLAGEGLAGEGLGEWEGQVGSAPLVDLWARHPSRRIASALDVVRVRLAPEADATDAPLDLARPETVHATAPPGRLRHEPGRRRLRRALARSLAPEVGDLLGFPGSSRSYWTLEGTCGSVAVVQPRSLVVARGQGTGEWRVRFRWGPTLNDLALVDAAALESLGGTKRRQLSGVALHKRLGWQPYYLVVALSGPRDGYCYKVVAGMLPRP